MRLHIEALDARGIPTLSRQIRAKLINSRCPPVNPPRRTPFRQSRQVQAMALATLHTIHSIVDHSIGSSGSAMSSRTQQKKE